MTSPARQWPMGDGPAGKGMGPDVPLVDLLDRLLETGVVVSGDVLLSVAGVDLVQLGLRAVLHEVGGAPAPSLPESPCAPMAQAPDPAESLPDLRRLAASRAGSRHTAASSPAERIGLDSDGMENGLVRLVLTVVELIRQVLERQAVRRADGGLLAEEDEERLGVALLRLNERMEDLKAYFGLSDEELQLHLGELRDVG